MIRTPPIPAANLRYIGYFNDPDSTDPSHDPGLGAPCVVCDQPLISQPERVTISLVHQNPELRLFSFFFRAHKACWNALPEVERILIESSIIDQPQAHRNTTTMPQTNLTFGSAISALKQGKRVCRAGWNGKGLFVFQQVPAEIALETIPKMQSLPDTVKAELTRRGGTIRYSDQLALVKPDNTINGWAPSTADALAEDWCVLDD